MRVQLTPYEQGMIAGDQGPGTQFAMDVIVKLAEVEQAERLIEIKAAHVVADHTGGSTLDLLRTLVALGGSFQVPTTLNIASIDQLHPELFHGDPADGAAAREVMDLTHRLGGVKSFTCAPYQLDNAPSFGEHVAWSESGAVIAANSVIGARTDRSGIFTDLCAALCARVPASGLHMDDNRKAGVIIDVAELAAEHEWNDLTYHLLGFWAGASSEPRIPAFVGLPDSVRQHQLQILGNAIATSSGLGMFHVVGVTPEAETLEQALGGGMAVTRFRPLVENLARVRHALTMASGNTFQAVCLGTPQYTVEECVDLLDEINEQNGQVDAAAPFYVNVNRHVLSALEERHLRGQMQDRRVTFVADACTYMAPLLPRSVRTVLTNSAKWAFYGPSERDVDVILASTRECVAFAISGEVRFDGHVGS